MYPPGYEVVAMAEPALSAMDWEAIADEDEQYILETGDISGGMQSPIVKAYVMKGYFNREDEFMARCLQNNWTIDFDELQAWAESIGDRIEALLPPEKTI